MSDDIIREVNEELQAERLRGLARRYGAAVIGAVAVVAIGAGIREFQVWRGHKADEAASSLYFAAMKDADSSHATGNAPTALTPSQKSAAATFETLSKNAPAGVRTLAGLRLAALRAGSGDMPGALSVWESIHNDEHADPYFRSLANLLWVQAQLDKGDPAVLRSRLLTLSEAKGEDKGAWRALARESLAMLDLREGHEADARHALADVSQDQDAPDGVRQRAGALLQTFSQSRTTP